jgi:antitoxin CptB|tara:strand:- start:324 stop:578 length:255 start_codon:yes stop_codon:yes gene_type:complete
MTNTELLKKKIIYRSRHRGFKEMDLLLGKFVNNCINDLNYSELNDLNNLLNFEDELLFKWYFENHSNEDIKKIKLSSKLRKFKL